VAWLQLVVYRDALVKHKALAAPAALRLRHGFQVFQNAALEVVNLFKSHGAHECS
jgi:hypothetical protein